MPAWLRRLRARWRYRRFQEDVAREVETHRAMAQSALERSGAEADAARIQAARALGNVTLTREEARSVWIAPWLEGLWQDLRYAVRSSRRRPGFAAAVILILALGSGLVTTVFSLGYGAFLRPWPVPDPNSVVVLYSRSATLNGDFPTISVAEFMYLDDRARTFQQLAFIDRGYGEQTTYRGAEIGRVAAVRVSRGYLDLIGTRFVAGRGFTKDEYDYLRPAPVAILGRGFWRRVFNSDAAAIGQTILLGKQTFTIVGVASATGFVDGYGEDSDIALPLATDALSGDSDRQGFTDPKARRSNVTMAGRLAPGLKAGQATVELTTLSRQFRETVQLPPIDVLNVTTRPVSWPSGRPEWPATKLAFLGLLLMHLLACANAGNLLLARGIARQRELAIRQALGAGRGRIVRQLLVETIALSVGAGLLALVVVWVVPPLVARPLEVFGAGRYSVDAPVLGFCLALSVLTALATGLAPALRSTSRGLGITSSTTQSPPPRALRLRRALLSTQVAFATALLASAGLLGRAVTHASSADPGFAVHEIAVIKLTLPRLANGKLYSQFYRDLHASLGTTEGPAIAFATHPPLFDSRVVGPVRRMDEPSGKARPFRRLDVSENYFDVMGVRLVSGRAPSANQPNEAVVSVSAARELWPGGENPIGQQLRHGWMGNEFEILTVVGVASDVALNSMVEREPALYKSAESQWGRILLLRDLTPAAVQRVQAAASALQPGATVAAHPLSDHIRQTLAASITGSRVAWGVSALGLLLATIGAFGVFAYAVEERKREIGIRLALGARRADVVGAVWAMAQRALIVGLTVGLALAMGGAQLLRRFLHGLSPFDPIAYLQIAGILLAAAALATWIPARRAARVDPAVTLRTD